MAKKNQNELGAMKNFADRRGLFLLVEKQSGSDVHSVYDKKTGSKVFTYYPSSKRVLQHLPESKELRADNLYEAIRLFSLKAK